MIPQEQTEDRYTDLPAYREQTERKFSEAALRVLLFVIQRRTTPILARGLYKVTYSNVYYETFPLEEQLEDDNPLDLMAVYVAGPIAFERC